MFSGHECSHIWCKKINLGKCGLFCDNTTIFQRNIDTHTHTSKYLYIHRYTKITKNELRIWEAKTRHQRTTQLGRGKKTTDTKPSQRFTRAVSKQKKDRDRERKSRKNRKSSKFLPEEYFFQNIYFDRYLFVRW